VERMLALLTSFAVGAANLREQIEKLNCGMPQAALS
jgi:hypothetical protein